MWEGRFFYQSSKNPSMSAHEAKNTTVKRFHHVFLLLTKVVHGIILLKNSDFGGAVVEASV